MPQRKSCWKNKFCAGTKVVRRAFRLRRNRRLRRRDRLRRSARRPILPLRLTQICTQNLIGRSPNRPSGGSCGLRPQRRLRRRGCAPHFRSPVLYPGQKSTCFITADALFLSIFRFLSIPPSACRSCRPQSFSRYPPASPAAAPSDRRKMLPYPTHRYGSAHTPPAPTSPAAIHCAE